MPAHPVEFSKKHGLAVITLNRPEARNALNPEMVEELGRAVQSCRSSDVRAVLLTGTGGSFCAGADVKDFVKQLDDGGPDALYQHVKRLAGVLHREVVLGLRRLDKPVVAAVNGVAAGGGFSLMLGCDIRIASSDARFFMAYANIGAAADGGSTYLLPRLVGSAKAMAIYLAAQPISAESALGMGLVTRVCPAAELEQHAKEAAMKLAQGPTVAYGRVKALFERSWEASLEDQLDAETEAISNSCLTRDFQEGIRAFVEKRQPKFQGK
ncbi:MAG: enoyl-CoA hydratase-related protein [Dehalococcoidia bacterium]|mgnify:CR=1 FL=1|jgi:2-(1,2-epoxy-1,2-dihydrophenyl)acetyl-CoA isomerase|nr:enoyl-CoA hydratase-related protein [Dehalococcoidia bacterium]